jgi:hypothetical protein
MVLRTDDDVHASARKTRVDEGATDLFLLAPNKLDVNVVGPLELHASNTIIVLTAQYPTVVARLDDGQTSQVLHKDEAGNGESAEWSAEEDGELEASLGREPSVGATPAPCKLERREGDDRCRKRCQQTLIPGVFF